MHIIFIGLRCDSTLLVFLGVLHKEKRRYRSLSVKTWVKDGSSIVLPFTVSCWACALLRCSLGLCLWMGLLELFLPFQRRLRWTILQSLRYWHPTKTNASQKLLKLDFFPVLRQSLMKPQVCMRWLYDPELGAGWWNLLLQEWKGVTASWAALGMVHKVSHKWGLARASHVVNLCIM